MQAAPPVRLNPAEEAAVARYCAFLTKKEPFACQMAIAAVLLNRLADKRYPDTVSGVLSDAGFSAMPVRDEELEGAKWAVRAVQLGVDPTAGALVFARAGTAAAAGIEITYSAGGFVFGFPACRETGSGV